MKKSKKTKQKTKLLISPSTITPSMFTGDQLASANLIEYWMRERKTRENMIFRLGGLSGTGKSALITYLIDHNKLYQEDCYVVAYTGQAVNVLRQRGILAKTIHSTFMKPYEEPLTDKNGKVLEKKGVPLTHTVFKPVKYIPESVKLIIVDEASFLPSSLEKLMLRYDVPILEVGDPLQLPPVSGDQCFHMKNLDYMMSDITRQEADSEIVDLATRIRNYSPIDISSYWNDVVFMWAKSDPKETFRLYKPFFKYADLIMTTNNRTRNWVTKLYRENFVNTDSPYPKKGEKLICRKNDWNMMLGEYPLTNGTIGTAYQTVHGSDIDKKTNTFTLDFKPDFLDDYFDGLECDDDFLRLDFGSKPNPFDDKKNPYKKFEYAYAITVWLAQGSQANTALFLDGWQPDAETHMRLRYTAVTRAQKKLYYMLPHSERYPGWTDLKKGGRRP